MIPSILSTEMWRARQHLSGYHVRRSFSGNNTEYYLPVTLCPNKANCSQTRLWADFRSQSHRQMSELEKTSMVVWSIWPSSRRANWGLGRQSSRLRITGFNGKTETRTQTSCITRLTLVYRPYHDMAVTLLNGDRNTPFSPFFPKYGIHTH